MALDPKYLESLPDSLVDMYGLVEMDILADMARRIETYDYFIPAAQHQNQKLQELGMVQSEIIAKLSAITGKSQAEIVALLTEAGEQAIQDDLEYYTAADVYKPDKVDTEALYKQLNSGLIQTEGFFKNLTRTIANTATQQFENALDRAWLQISTGAFDYVTAIKNAIIDLSSNGLGAVKYPSGRVDSIEVAVRRAVVTGANQTASKTQEKLADQLEVDLVEVTAHGGARPEHAKWQGKVYGRKGRVEIDGVVYEGLAQATGYGSGAGLCGWNCRHNFHPYIPGTARTWNDKQLERLEEKKIEYNGVKMTEYEASQTQRKIEREIRKQKRTIAALEAAGEDASEYRSRLRDAQKSYTDFTKQTGIKKQSARTQVATGTGTAIPAPKKPPIEEKNTQQLIRATKTTEELEKVMQKATGKKYNLSGAEPELMKRQMEQLTALSEEYGVRYDSVTVTTARRYLGEVNRTGRYGDVVELNYPKKYYKSREALLAELRKNAETGSMPKIGGRNIDIYTTTHEFAHALSEELTSRLYGYGRDVDFWDEIETVYADYKKRGGGVLGKYASTNQNEFVAEAFAEAKLNPRPSKWAIATLDIIDKYFKKKT